MGEGYRAQKYVAWRTPTTSIPRGEG